MKQPATRLFGPALTMGAGWLTKKGLDAAYQKRTGSKPPTAGDRQASMSRIIIWAVISAVALTAVDVLINRALAAVDGEVADRETTAESVAVQTDETS